MAEDFNTGAAYLEEARRAFRGYLRQAEGAMAQIDDQEFFHQPDAESNSVAILVKHLAGNHRSRWTDMLTTDGEKPDRNRDQEFVLAPADTRAELMRRWEEGWAAVFDTLQSLTPADLGRTVRIRQEPHTALQVINRSLMHAVGHVGQILYLCKHMRGAEWKTLSVAKGKSAEFNAMKPEDRKYKSPHRG